jgi:hypothetical protein
MLFTGELLRVWRNGAFKGRCMDFRAGWPSAAFGRQRPFTV